MARIVNLWLKANGNDIPGEPETTGIAGELADTIECLAFEDSVTLASESTVGSLRSGRRRYGPIRFRKRVDKATPLIQQALVDNAVVEARFEFRRHSVSGDGTVEHYFTIAIQNGRIAGIERSNPDVWDATDAADRFNEWVSLTFETITWTHETASTQAHDEWDDAAS